MHFMFQFVMAFWGRNKVCTVSSTRIRVYIYISYKTKTGPQRRLSTYPKWNFVGGVSEVGSRAEAHGSGLRFQGTLHPKSGNPKP